MNTKFATLCLLSVGATAWWDKGHIIAARVAYDILEAEAPEALVGANAELSVLKHSTQTHILATDHERDYPFVECAPFADTIKGQGYSFQSDWHFINQPYTDEDASLESYPFEFDPEEPNVTNSIESIHAWMLASDGYQTTALYTKVMSYFDNEMDARSFALRLLIHYIADSHQPCHSITLVNDEFPNGDRGCNSVQLPSFDGASNLHAVWDSVLYEEINKQSLPLSEQSWDFYGDEAKRFVSTHPLAESDFKTADPQGWAEENMDAAQYVYMMEENEPLSDKYVERANDKAEQRIAWAGRRMAEMMKMYYGVGNYQVELFLQ